ncbi:dethiobiotin synthetase [Selenomonas ruminantium]|uniref:ATP-dependent dethiobiotin synthetase BioD n=1 Tax=Selenomonas ruminantium TaxID=971 RepID=A0A1M6X9H1_SELRU|nr:dethiobiotin synthase [Selenomonas ruminantium]SHL02586.1 dethiobiotin synthetase [Selenomonas ruminantium]
MSRNLFVTGTGTEIGKTYVAGLIVKTLHDAGMDVAYYKAAMSGNDRRPDGTLIPGDALFVKEFAQLSQSLASMCPYVYENAVSPHLASRIEGHPVRMEVVEETFHAVSRKHDYVVVEGSGGITCPISWDEERIQLEDIVRKLQLPSIMVADAGLGTINSVVLTYAYMKQKELPLKGIFFNNFHRGDVMEEDNRRMCEKMTGLPVLSCIAKGDNELPGLPAEKLAALFA